MKSSACSLISLLSVAQAQASSMINFEAPATSSIMTLARQGAGLELDVVGCAAGDVGLCGLDVRLTTLETFVSTFAAATTATLANVTTRLDELSALTPAPTLAQASCGAGNQWVTWSTGTTIGYPGIAARDLIRASGDNLHRVCDSSLGSCVYIQDAQPDFMRGDYLTANVAYDNTQNERHYWRSRDSNIKCAASADATLVDASVFDVNCNPTSGIGNHQCGSQNGWILWHAGHTYGGSSGGHPCEVSGHTTGSGLNTHQICVPDAAATAYAANAPLTTSTCPSGRSWQFLSDVLPTINAATASQKTLISGSTHLFKIATAGGGAGIYIYDPAPDFVRDDYLTAQTSYGGTANERHFWRSTDISAIQCASGSNQPLVSTGMSGGEMSCTGRGVGTHNCGSQNGWILWHAGHTYGGSSGGHPCEVSGHTTGSGLSKLYVCA